MIRDFIYFDKQKVISYGSQLLGGFTSSIVESVEKSKGTETTIDGGVTAEGGFKLGKDTASLLGNIISRIGDLEVSVGGESNLSNVRNKNEISIVSEEKLLDHYQFEILRKALIEQNMLKNLDEIKEHDWSNGNVKKKIKPSDFVEFTCRVKLYDAKHLQSVAESFEQIVNFMQQMTMSQMIQSVSPEDGDLNEIINSIAEGDTAAGYAVMKETLGDSIEPLLFNAMIELMKEISDGRLSTISTQFMIRHSKQAKNDFKFIAPVREENLVDSKDEMIFKYGYEPEQDWKVLAQICKLPKKNSESNQLSAFSNINSGSMDSIVGEITEAFTLLSSQLGLHSMIKHPDISINLIALYR